MVYCHYCKREIDEQDFRENNVYDESYCPYCHRNFGQEYDSMGRIPNSIDNNYTTNSDGRKYCSSCGCEYDGNFCPYCGYGGI